MTKTEFGSLEEIPLRGAWSHEAHDFTPWLADNIDRLSDTIGVPLELTGTEVAVESFSADILARNTLDESVVLIENQLETTDHKHLGQIMTYLAGLDAHTVVWMAPEFRQPHLSAIRWLNEHTADGFSFFAVKARVVRIGDSPFAPLFEVVEKPDNWLRQLKSETTRGNLTAPRQGYYLQLKKQVPALEFEHVGQGLVVNLPSNDRLRISIEARRNKVGLSVMADIEEYGDLEKRILEVAPNIEQTLAPIRETRWGGALYASKKNDLDQPDTWAASIEWLAEKIRSYHTALTETQ